MTSYNVGAAFRTHQNYIEAITLALDFKYTPERFEGGYYVIGALSDVPAVNKALAQEVRASQAFQRISRRQVTEMSPLAAALRNAWTTELLMALAGRLLPDAALSASNTWTVVQAYYAVFHATRALALASGQQDLQTHAAAQAFFQDWWGNRSFKYHPWDLAYGNGGMVNSPFPPSKATVSNLEECDHWNFPSFLEMSLRTTRGLALEDALQNAREEKARARRRAQPQAPRLRRGARRPSATTARLKPEERQRVEETLRPHTIFDYLYRLRIRSNYVDTEMWSEGPRYPAQASGVHRNLMLITGATLLLNELIIRQYLGASAFEAILSPYVASSWPASMPTEGILARKSVLHS